MSWGFIVRLHQAAKAALKITEKLHKAAARQRQVGVW